MITNLQALKPGTPFRLREMPELQGVLVDVNECSANVKLSRGVREVEITDRDGEVRRFTANRSQTTIWSPATLVEVISHDEVGTPPAASPPPAVAIAAPALLPFAVTDSDLRSFNGGWTLSSNHGDQPEETEDMDTATKKKTRKATAPKAAKPAKVTKPAAEPKQPKAEKAAKPDKPLSQLAAAVKVLEKAKEPMTAKEIVAEMEAQGLWKSPGGKTPDATLYSGMNREIRFKQDDSRFEMVTAGKFRLVKKSK